MIHRKWPFDTYWESERGGEVWEGVLEGREGGGGGKSSGGEGRGGVRKNWL